MIKRKDLVILIGAIALLSPATMEGKGWRGILPLHSTRADVEKLLGRPSSEPPAGNCACFYDLADQTVIFLYANGVCEQPEQGDGKVGGWNVARDTVVEISIHFKRPRKLSEFKIEETRYQKTPDPEMSALTYYTDAGEGITLGVAGGIEVLSITYFHSSKDQNLRCAKKHT
jgi:hypothetical protein